MSPRVAGWLTTVLTGCAFELAPAGGTSDVPGDARLDAPPDVAPADLDGDTVVNAADNCPAVSNADQRDHDNDSRGDACDVCPHLSSATHADSDADGIGDDCDPRPMLTGDVVSLWDGFYADSGALAWVKLGSWSLDAGALRQTAQGVTYIAMPMSLTRTFLQTAAVVDSVNGTTSTIGVFAGDPLDDLQSYGCLAERNAAVQTVVATAAWSGVPGLSTPMTWAGAVAAGRRFRFDLTLSSALTCVVRQDIVVATDTEQVGPHTGQAGFYLDDLTTRFDYVFVVQIGS